MNVRTLEANVRWLADLAIIDLRGELDGSAEEPLEAAYRLAEEPNPSTILLNLARVDYINSKGIALIVVLLSQARQAGRRLLACGLSDHYREIFRLTRLSEHITVCTDQGSALAEAGFLERSWPGSPGPGWAMALPNREREA